MMQVETKEKYKRKKRKKKIKYRKNFFVTFSIFKLKLVLFISCKNKKDDT